MFLNFISVQSLPEVVDGGSSLTSLLGPRTKLTLMEEKLGRN